MTQTYTIPSFLYSFLSFLTITSILTFFTYSSIPVFPFFLNEFIIKPNVKPVARVVGGGESRHQSPETPARDLFKVNAKMSDTGTYE